MSTLLIVVIAVTVAAAYLTTGWRLAVKDLPNAWERARAEWRYDDMRLASVKEQTTCMIFLWPFLGPVRRFSHGLERMVKETDPKELQRQLDERASYISQLERELGIGDRA